MFCLVITVIPQCCEVCLQLLLIKNKGRINSEKIVQIKHPHGKQRGLGGNREEGWPASCITFQANIFKITHFGFIYNKLKADLLCLRYTWGEVFAWSTGESFRGTPLIILGFSLNVNLGFSRFLDTAWVGVLWIKWSFSCCLFPLTLEIKGVQWSLAWSIWVSPRFCAFSCLFVFTRPFSSAR